MIVHIQHFYCRDNASVHDKVLWGNLIKFLVKKKCQEYVVKIHHLKKVYQTWHLNLISDKSISAFRKLSLYLIFYNEYVLFRGLDTVFWHFFLVQQSVTSISQKESFRCFVFVTQDFDWHKNQFSTSCPWFAFHLVYVHKIIAKYG